MNINSEKYGLLKKTEIKIGDIVTFLDEKEISYVFNKSYPDLEEYCPSDYLVPGHINTEMSLLAGVTLRVVDIYPEEDISWMRYLTPEFRKEHKEGFSCRPIRLEVLSTSVQEYDRHVDSCAAFNFNTSMIKRIDVDIVRLEELPQFSGATFSKAIQGEII